MLVASLILLQVIIFGGLIFVLRHILTQNVVLATKHLDEMSQDYSKKEQDIQKKLESLKDTTQQILSKAHDDGLKAKEEIIKEAEKERDRIVLQARAKGDEMIKQADKSRRILLDEIEDRVAKEAVSKACDLVQDVLPEEFKQIMHAHWIEELIKNGFSHLKHLSIAEDIEDVVIKSAFSLTEEQRKFLSKKLKEVLGRDVALKEVVEPKMVAGVIITIGSLVLDGSFNNKIQEQAKKLQL
jgi:F0F1-type ATP synthase delta subunit